VYAKKSNDKKIRFDLETIASWVEPGACVLDLGCGDGRLLEFLMTRKEVKGTGIEQREDLVARCVEKGLPVIQGDINREIVDYPDNAFDYVIVSRTLQQVYDPPGLLREILRIGKKAVVSFPNFSYWRIRLQLLFTGNAPVTPQLPYQWYDTPNIRVITLKDFRRFSGRLGFEIFREEAVQANGRSIGGRTVRFMPDLRATYGIYLIGKDKSS